MEIARHIVRHRIVTGHVSSNISVSNLSFRIGVGRGVDVGRRVKEWEWEGVFNLVRGIDSLEECKV